MRVIILGAGEVGYEIARILSKENHDVVVVDVDAGALQKVNARLDVLTIQGNGTAVSVLKQAGIQQADMLIAVTSADEVNIITCMIADRLRVKTTIARIRSHEYTKESSVLKAGDLGITLVIHPEESTANEIVRLLHRASATDILPFAGGKVLLVGMRISDRSPLLRRSMIEMSELDPTLVFRVMGISRGIRTILPGGNERLHRNDQIFVLAKADDVSRVTKLFRQHETQIQHIMILGGTATGATVAQALSQEKGKHVKLIESDLETAERLAEELPNVLVIHGKESDLDLLATEGITEMDAFVAVQEDEATNLVTCLMAKHLGVSKTIALLSNTGYIPLTQRIGLDAAVNKKLSISREVLRFLRGKHVLSVATVHGLDVEILEMTTAPDARITKRPLKRMKLPYGILIGIVVKPEGMIEVATGDTEIEAGDQVIVFALSKRVEEVEKLFGT